jgi:hypothetical protein
VKYDDNPGLRALQQLVDTINATGGLVAADDGFLAPAADPEWIDLAPAYLNACRVLGMEPQVKEDA